MIKLKSEGSVEANEAEEGEEEQYFSQGKSIYEGPLTERRTGSGVRGR